MEPVFIWVTTGLVQTILITILTIIIIGVGTLDLDLAWVGVITAWAITDGIHPIGVVVTMDMVVMDMVMGMVSITITGLQTIAILLPAILVQEIVSALPMARRLREVREQQVEELKVQTNASLQPIIQAKELLLILAAMI